MMALSELSMHTNLEKLKFLKNLKVVINFGLEYIVFHNFFSREHPKSFSKDPNTKKKSYVVGTSDLFSWSGSVIFFLKTFLSKEPCEQNKFDEKRQKFSIFQMNREQLNVNLNIEKICSWCTQEVEI